MFDGVVSIEAILSEKNTNKPHGGRDKTQFFHHVGSTKIETVSGSAS
jgi:hypothetical protein